MADLEVSHTMGKWDREPAIEHLQKALVTPLKAEGGIVPKGAKLTVNRYIALAKENPGWPSWAILARAISGKSSDWNDALKVAGLEISNARGEWDRGSAVEHLKKAAVTPLKSESGIVPKGAKLTRDRYRALAKENPGWPLSHATLARAITGKSSDWNDAMKAAELEVSRVIEEWDRKSAIKHLQKAAVTPLKSEGGIVPEGTKLTIDRYMALAKENAGWPLSYATLTKAITGNRDDWNGAKTAAGL